MDLCEVQRFCFPLSFGLILNCSCCCVTGLPAEFDLRDDTGLRADAWLPVPLEADACLEGDIFLRNDFQRVQCGEFAKLHAAY